MKRIALIAMMVLGVAGFARAQGIYTPTTDVLGAHLNYGRGCAACHAPHSGAYGNGAAKTADPNAGTAALWGEDVGSLYGQTIVTGQMLPNGTSPGTTFSETLPTSLSASTPDAAGVLTCLSCHDGNLAEGAMMKGVVYEKLPSTYGTYNKVPTLLGNDGSTAGNYLNDHPVGLNAVMGCGGPYNWDCTISGATVQMTGTASKQFVANYGFFVSPGNYNNTPVVLCTTCHNQHLMNVVNVTAKNSGQPAGTYATMFFLRGPYNPASTTVGSNQTAQFCRQCHGGESNEMNGSTAGTTF
jgi:hypothetical protein